MNENKNTTYQNVQDAQREIHIFKGLFLKKEESIKSIIDFHLKKLEKVNRMQKKQEEGKIKRRVEINEVENGQIVQKNQ